MVIAISPFPVLTGSAAEHFVEMAEANECVLSSSPSSSPIQAMPIKAETAFFTEDCSHYQ